MFKVNWERKNSDSEKWHKYAGRDVLPMWIADCEFEAPDGVKAALQERLNQGVFGYPYLTDEFKDAVVQHCRRLYGWAVRPEWVTWLNGVVPGLNLTRALVRARGKSEALTVEPVYPHLRKHTPIIDFKNVASGVILEKGRWLPDFAALEANVNANTGLLLLCSPHNPIGTVYSREELERFHAIARRHDLLVCADEIHCDLILNGQRHIPFASLDEDAAQRTITLMAASKTFNIAGLCTAWAIIPNPELRREFARLRAGISGDANLFGQRATIAALTTGEDWRQQQLAYLRDNERLLRERLNATGKLTVTEVGATYLAWIDCRALPVANAQQFFEEHGVGLSDGADFGTPGFVRLNFGCGRELLEEALQRMEKALATLA